MDKVVREPSEQWDDVPAKVVGRRRKPVLNLESGEAFFRLGRELGEGKVGRKRGVVRYRTHAEANAW
ncbi:MAG TPA: hypothetical protein PKE12_00465 [Kiritimatiellia bacterium]|nr:hypothetical protein [Kiritimatiellia bacterium]